MKFQVRVNNVVDAEVSHTAAATHGAPDQPASVHTTESKKIEMISSRRQNYRYFAIGALSGLVVGTAAGVTISNVRHSRMAAAASAPATTAGATYSQEI